jgi:LuxR family quorum-sensing transcriptional regulator LasR
MDDRFVREAVNILPSLALMRDFAFESLPNLAQPLSDASWSPHLTRREIECLKWCAQGKSSWDISQILRRSEAVVNFHFNNLRKKFNTTSRRHAVVKAIRLGLIHP